MHRLLIILLLFFTFGCSKDGINSFKLTLNNRSYVSNGLFIRGNNKLSLVKCMNSDSSYRYTLSYIGDDYTFKIRFNYDTLYRVQLSSPLQGNKNYISVYSDINQKYYFPDSTIDLERISLKDKLLSGELKGDVYCQDRNEKDSIIHLKCQFRYLLPLNCNN